MRCATMLAMDRITSPHPKRTASESNILFDNRIRLTGPLKDVIDDVHEKYRNGRDEGYCERQER